MIDKIFTLFGSTNVYVIIVIFVIALIAVGYVLVKIQEAYLKKFWIEKELIIIGPELASKEVHEKEGFGPQSTHPNAVCFYMLASENGKSDMFIYKSELLCSQKDDIWLIGEINGLKTKVF
ncbi:MAG: hypothetical protein ACPGTS_01920, partial [Minisyncoccia bacterium]